MWIHSNYLRQELKDTKFNSMVCMDRDSVNNFADVISSIGGAWFDFDHEVSSIRYYPFTVKPYFDGFNNPVLTTPKGSFSSVPAYKVSYRASYLTLGEYFVEHYFNDFRDYKGFTVIKCFLPYLGLVDIDPNECVNKYLQFRLSIDYITGVGTYIIGVSDDSIKAKELPYADENEDSSIRVISVHTCQIGFDVPLNSTNIGDIKRNVAINALKIAGTAAGMYLQNPIPQVSTTVSTKTYDISSRGKYKGARLVKSKTGTETTESTTTKTRAVDNSKAYHNIFDSALSALNYTPPYHGGDRPNDIYSLWDMTNKIQLIFYYPKYVIRDVYSDSNYKHIFGLPLGRVKNLGELRGFTIVQDVHFESIADDSGNIDQATQYEIDLIISKLKDGVILSEVGDSQLQPI